MDNIIERIKRLKEKSSQLSSVIWTNEELQELKQSVDFLEHRIQTMMKATISNFHWYQQEGWKLFKDGEEDEHE